MIAAINAANCVNMSLILEAISEACVPSLCSLVLLEASRVLNKP